MEFLQLENLSKTFDDKEQLEVIDNISLQIKRGEFICFLGPSGCGKTVLLWLIAGFEPPSQGKILFEGREIKELSLERVMVSQDYGLLPWKTVLGNVELGLENKKISKQEKRKAAWEIIRKIGLFPFQHWPIHKLSGGMQQRVAIARAFCANPEIILMDEPFSALDSQYKDILRQELIRIWQETKKTIIFVTHSISESIILGDRIVVLSARPAKIKKIIKIDLPRPRNKHSRQFNYIEAEISKIIAGEVNKAYQRQDEILRV